MDEQRPPDEWPEQQPGTVRYWAVLSGHWSDESTDCVCSSERLAKEIARRLDLGWNNTPGNQGPSYRDRMYQYDGGHRVEPIDFVESADAYIPKPQGYAWDDEAT